MPRTRKPKPTDVPDTILDHFARSGPLSAADVEAAMRRFKKALIERALGGELTHISATRPAGPSRRPRPITAMARARKPC